MSIPIFNDDIKEFPTYLLVVNQSKLDKFLNRFTYFLRRRMLIQNNIYLMLDNYDYNSKKEKVLYSSTFKFCFNSNPNESQMKHYLMVHD